MSDCKILCLLMLALPFAAAAQKENLIYLNNPSFEDVPSAGQTPMGWTNCGDPRESPPDVQPGFFDVTKAPSHGASYLGLVVRDNETWESVSQRLSKPIEVNQCYEFSMDICKSELYRSLSRTSGQISNYATPARLLIWGGTGSCGKQELLYETPIITHTRWIKTDFRLSPKKGTYSYIVIEAYYKTPVLFPYNGNVMLDNASAIRQVPCNPEKMPDMAKKTDKPDRPAGGVRAKGDTAKGATAPKIPATKVEPVVTYKGEKIRKGSIIRLEKVYFDADKFDIKEECEPGLKEVYNFLASNKEVSVEVGGHTNNNPSDQFANELSTSRAKSVAAWLITQGIPSTRVQFKGYGKTRPIESNLTPEGRKKNQRVEIKVLNIQ